MTIDFTEAELRKFAPKMAEFYKRALLDGKAHMGAAGILDNGKRLAHFLGQCGAETGGFTVFRESMTYSSVKRISEVWPARAKKSTSAELKALVRNPVALADWAYGGRMGNRKGTSDGYNYRGGGVLQVTGRANVQKLCDLARIEIRPDILDDPEATLQLACAEWEDAGCNKLADANNHMGISKAINVGSATSGVMPNGMEHREAWFKKARAIWWDADMKATETAPPPTVAQNVKTTAAQSRTVFGSILGLLATVGAFFKDTIAVFVEAAGQLDMISPAVKVASALGITTERAMFAVGVAAVGMVLYAKLDDTIRGKVLK